MKAGNLFLIIITSIITFIGLACSKLYDKYIKNNVLVQIMLYIFWTLLSLRALIWIGKPFIPHGIPRCLQHIDLSGITIPELSPFIALTIFIAIIVGVCIFFKNLIQGIK